MILSVSRRTDIPAYYFPWFLRRLQAGYVLVRNPRNPRQVSKVALSPEVVDGIVFWTKNPLPMFGHWSALAAYPYYIQFTLTPYGKELESGLPGKEQVLLPAFQGLARQLGKERLVWRYDPILLGGPYTIDYHCRQFAHFAKELQACTQQCVISFLTDYRHNHRRLHDLAVRPPLPQEKLILAEKLAPIAAACDIALTTCAETMELTHLGVGHSCCIDAARLEQLGGVALRAPKDKHQRPACGCAASIDIGAYDTCPNGCVYCYANHSADLVQNNAAKHDPAGPLLVGQLEARDVVKERQMTSYQERQQKLF